MGGFGFEGSPYICIDDFVIIFWVGYFFEGGVVVFVMIDFEDGFRE